MAGYVWKGAKPQPGVYTPGLCGESKGYHRHRRERTTPCAECKTAHAEDTKERAQKKKAP